MSVQQRCFHEAAIVNVPAWPAGSGGQRAGTLALLEALRQAMDRTAAAQRTSSPGGTTAGAAADDEEQLLLDSQARGFACLRQAKERLCWAPKAVLQR